MKRSCIFCLWLAVSATVPATDPAPPAPLLEHAARLRQTLPAAGYTVVAQPPFVVIGNEPPATVRRRTIDTIGWAVDRLKRDFFEREPADCVEIWLMKDQPSYEACATGLLGGQPLITQGFYAPRQHALLINLAAGTGTLVHEIVHPFIHANFPACPPWFNEGFAALFETATDRDGHIIGLTNWRLPHLQRLIRSDRCPAIESVTAMDEVEFYHRDEADNYAVARYVCYYLQERGQLGAFYRAFRANCATDPTGLRTLQQTVREPDPHRLQRNWEKFVRSLTTTR